MTRPRAQRNQPEAAIEAIERARRLSPFDPYTFFYAVNIAAAHLAARRFEQAIEWADRALHDQPRLVTAMRVKVVALAHLGHLNAARAELSRVLAIDPKLTIVGFSRVRALCGTRSSRTLRHRPAPGWPAGGVARKPVRSGLTRARPTAQRARRAAAADCPQSAARRGQDRLWRNRGSGRCERR